MTTIHGGRRSGRPSVPPRLVDITDQRFGHLTVLHREPGRVQNSTVWMCLCDCGNYKRTTRRKLEAGQIISCGMHVAVRPPTFYQAIQDLRREGKGRIRIGRELGVSTHVIAGIMWRMHANPFNTRNPHGPLPTSRNHPVPERTPGPAG